MASIPGLEKAKIMQYGYANEYDFIDPRALTRTLGLRQMPGFWPVRSMAQQVMRRLRRRGWLLASMPA